MRPAREGLSLDPAAIIEWKCDVMTANQRKELKKDKRWVAEFTRQHLETAGYVVQGFVRGVEPKSRRLTAWRMERGTTTEIELQLSSSIGLTD